MEMYQDNEEKTEEADYYGKFECPVCNCLISPPMRQCVNSHTFCSICNSKIENCPICRGEKSHKIPSQLEVFYKKSIIPCQFRNEGCQEKAIGLNIQFHEKYCKYNYVKCPFKETLECTWYNSKVVMTEHLQKFHSDSYHEGNVVNFVLRKFKHKKERLCGCEIIKAHDVFFKMWWFYQPTNRKMYWRLGHADQYEEYKYHYKITVGDKMILKNRIHDYLRENEDILVQLRWINFDDSLQYCDEDGNLTYQIHIIDMSVEEDDYLTENEEEESDDDCVEDKSKKYADVFTGEIYNYFRDRAIGFL